jgi:tetratricopeptide (TPR) repeat protein
MAVEQSATNNRPQLRPSAELFYDAFNYFAAGKYGESEQLFELGLDQNDKDYKAWEYLALTKKILGKDKEAELSLQEAAKRGLGEARVEEIRAEWSLIVADQLPPIFERCMSAQAKHVLKKLRVPKPRSYKYEGPIVDSYWLTPPKLLQLIHEYKASGAGFSVTGRTIDAKLHSFTNYRSQFETALGGFVTIYGDCRDGPVNAITALEVIGTVFPMKKGSNFTVISQFGNSYAVIVVKRCEIGETVKAKETLPDYEHLRSLPGYLTYLTCSSKVNKEENPQNVVIFSWHLGSIVETIPKSRTTPD